MPIDVMWDDDQKTIIRQLFTDPWTVQDYLTMSRRTRELIESVDYFVDVIMDGAKSRRIPPGIINVLNAVHEMVHPRQRFLVGVVGFPLARRTFNLIAKMAPRFTENMEAVDTLSEARVNIARRRGEKIEG